MQGLRHDCAFARLAAASLGSGDALRLVDIGGVGSGASGWRCFGDKLQVLADIVDASERRGSADRSSAPGRWADDRARDLSSGAAAPLEAWLREPAAANPTASADAPFTADLASLIQARGFADADVLVLEPAADDLQILRQLAAILDRPSLLGVSARLNFFGGAGAEENTAHNVDRLLRQHGFDLYGMDLTRHASAALPWPFLWPHPGAAFSGRPTYAQAVYMRDPGGKAPWARLLKAAALRALFNLPDQAAEILTLGRGALAVHFDVEAGLDLLTAQIQQDTGGGFARHADYQAAFERGDAHFYGFQQRHHDWLTGLQTFRREGAARISHLEDTLRDMANTLHAGQTDSSTSSQALDRVRAQVDQPSRIYPGHHGVFDLYTPYRGPADPAYHLDFIGSRTLGSYGDWITPVAVDHYESAPPPIDEEYFEWIDILQAVADAGPVFTMLELGAGYGRWSARAALAARQRGKRVRLGAAEAEPRHRQWLAEHLKENGVAAGDLRLFDQAVGGEYGEVAFTVGATAGATQSNWFGQAIAPLDLRERPPTGEYFGMPVYEQGGWQAILVPKIPLSEVLEPYAFIDLADFDLQGAEGEAIAEAIEPLTRKTRRLHIGTHSEQIEAQLRELLPRHGWVCLRDYSLHKLHDTPFGRAQFVDGVQSWINPARL